MLSKLSRYEYEKRRHNCATEGELEAALRSRGSDYNTLLYHHYVHKGCENTVVHALKERGVDTLLVNRFDYTADAVSWSDAVISVGGDGTFLLAAAKVTDCQRPVIGFNSDPTRSKGHLLLSRHYSVHVREAVSNLLQGRFNWLYRQRIQVTLHGKDVDKPPIELHDQQLSSPEHRYLDLEWPQGRSDLTGDSTERGIGQEPSSSNPGAVVQSRVLPVLALNEVYIGECLSARVSYYELSIDGCSPFKQKSSGLCVSSGTGSSSWTYNINKLTHQTVVELMSAVSAETGLALDTDDPQLVASIKHRVNSLLLFDPGDSRMCYTIRDPILPVPARNATRHSAQGPLCEDLRPRGLAASLTVRSRCFDACLVLDGGLSYTFNDGTTAELVTRPQHRLRTVQMISHTS